MITMRTRVQLLVFVIITLIGVSFVGARYAQLDRLVLDQTYTVKANLPDSGGVYAGAEVTYRGTSIGKVDKLELYDEGVKAVLEIEDSWDEIPADTLALVGNRSALGEQYLELQPMSDGEPYLEDDSEIAIEHARLPIPTAQLLSDVSTTVANVDRDALQTVVTEMGKAFEGTGDDLGQIIDTSNSFIQTANENFDVTTSLIRDSRIVLDTQLDSASAIRTFSSNLAAFSTTLVDSDTDIRRLIDNGSMTANELRTFIEDNEVELARLLNNLRTTGELQVMHLDGLEQILVVYPYVVEGGFSVVSKDPQTGKYDAHFGAVLTDRPHVCHKGYEAANKRPPTERGNLAMVTTVRCAEPPTKTNARGAQNAPRPRAAASYSSPVVARFDPTTGDLTWTWDAGLPGPGTLGAQLAGDREESWKWLLLQPLVKTTE